MEKEIEEVIEVIESIETEIIKKSLEERIYDLERMVHLLNITKVSNNNFQQLEYMLTGRISDEESRKVEYALEVLSKKQFRVTPFVVPDDKINEDMLNDKKCLYIPKSVAEEYPPNLFENRLPSYTETIDIISKILNRNKKVAFEFLMAIYNDGKFKNFLPYILFINP